MSWKLFKLCKATDEFLLKARMEGRLVYTPYPGTTRFCNTLKETEISFWAETFDEAGDAGIQLWGY